MLVVQVGLPAVLALVGEASGLHNEVAAAAAAVVVVVVVAVQEDTEIDERKNVKFAVVEERAAAIGGE